MNRCPYCGSDCREKTCRGCSDLPEIERELSTDGDKPVDEQPPGCATCGGPMPKPSRYAGYVADEFCSARCCRIAHGVTIPGDDSPVGTKARDGTARLVS